ncbi:hypothetical protein Bpfe_003489, partial [Biomphalaria pfeifferi]
MFGTMSFFSFLAYFVLITVVYCASFDDCKDTELQVHLQNFTYKDCDTKCTKGLLLNDTIRLYGTIIGIAKENVSEKDEIMIKKLEGGIDIDVDKLENCIRGESKTYTCSFNISTLNITYYELVRNTRKKLEVYLNVTYNNVSHCSETTELPEIFDPSNVTLFVNAQNVTESYQRIIVENSLLNFHCEDDIEPCDAYMNPLNITLNINGIELTSNEQIIELADSNLDITFTNSPERFYIYMYKNSTEFAFNQTRLLVKNITIEDNIYTFAICVCGVHINVTYSPKFTNKSNYSTERTSVYVSSGPILDVGYIVGLFSLGIIFLITTFAKKC